MRKRAIKGSRWLSFVNLALYAGIACILGTSCSNTYEGMVVAVELNNDSGQMEGSRLVALDPERPEKDAVELVSDFASAASPALSHEGRYLYFQGQKQENDPWQIWVMDLKKGKITQVMQTEENCTHPASLPDGSVVFSRESSVKGKKVLNLWKCRMDGCCPSQLTHNPALNTYSSVLWEGRIIYSSSQVYPEIKDPQLMIMRPDGTKSELYSPGFDGLVPQSRGLESPDGHIYFISSDGHLSRVLHRRPLHTFENLSEDLSGSFVSVSPDTDSTCLVSYLPADGQEYGIYRFDPRKAEAPQAVFTADQALIDPIPIHRIDPRPRILPSPVDPSKPTAILMIQDINHTSIPVNEGISGDSVADRIRYSTMEGELGVVKVKDDGSVYVKLDADTPFRMETINSQGEVVRGPSDWIYLRPNERRACTGCHLNPELAPRNYQPHAIKEDPVILASHNKENSH